MVALSAAEAAVSGAVASIAATASLHPLDTIKTVQQASPTRLSALASFLLITRRSGVAGLYAGVLPFLIAEALAGAIKFSSFEMLLTVMNNPFLAAAIAFLASSVLIIPGEYIKARLQTGQQFSSRGGNFFVGADAVLLRDVPYTILELGLYDVLKRQLLQLFNEPVVAEMVAAAIAGAVAGWLTNPMDVLKTKMMASTTQSGKSLTIIDAAKEVLLTQGWQGFTAGSLARVAWVVPFTVIYLQTYEFTKRQLISRKMRTLF